MKGLKENIQNEKGKLEHWKLTQNSPKPNKSKGTNPNSPKLDHSRGTHPRLAQVSPRRVQSKEVGLFLVKLAQGSNI